MSLFSKLFGGTDTTAIDAQAEQNRINAQEISRLNQIARSDILDLFPAAERANIQGAQGALDVFGQTIPQQTNLFQQGNLNAQQSQLTGLQQIQQALMGTPIDFGAQQVTPLSVDTSFAQQQIPDFTLSNELNLREQQTPAQPDILRLLAELGFTGGTS